MVNIKLKKPYEGQNAGDIIAVSNNVAFGLIEQGIAEQAQNRDFIVKPEFGVSKAFEGSPSQIGFKKKVGKPFGKVN